MEPAPGRAAPTVSDRWIVVALIIAAVAPYAGTLAFGYVLDDTTAIRSNPDMNGWESLLKVWAHPYGGGNSPFFGLYRPLTMALFAFVWNAGGQWPLWFHLLAISMHALATLLLWRLLARAGGRVPAALGALWFAVHPVHVEAVTSVANSSEILVAIWTCALALYLRRANDTSGPVSWGRAAGAGALYLAAFLSKESGAVAPVLATLWVWGGSRPENPGPAVRLSALATRWWRVAAAWVAVGVVVVVLRSAVLGGPVTGESIAVPGLNDRSALERIWAMLSLGPTILELLVWPSILNPHYGPTAFPPSGADWRAAATAAVLVAATVAGTWFARRGDRRVLVAIAWMLIGFLPASNLFVPTGQVLAERTLYVPSIGLTMLVAWALDLLRVRALESHGWRIARTAAVAALCALAAESALRTARWKDVWRSHPTLFAQMIAADSIGYRGYWLTALEARGQGRMDEALGLFARAYALFPGDRGLMIDYAETLSRSGQPARAALLLGLAHESRGDTAAAIAAYRAGLRAAPGDTTLEQRLKVLRVSR